MSDHRKMYALMMMEVILTILLRVSYLKTISELIRASVGSVTSQKSDTGSGIGFQGGAGVNIPRQSIWTGRMEFFGRFSEKFGQKFQKRP